MMAMGVCGCGKIQLRGAVNTFANSAPGAWSLGHGYGWLEFFLQSKLRIRDDGRKGHTGYMTSKDSRMNSAPSVVPAVVEAPVHEDVPHPRVGGGGGQSLPWTPTDPPGSGRHGGRELRTTQGRGAPSVARPSQLSIAQGG